MRIERIELQNWMSYPRRWVLPDGLNGGEEVVPTIDLSAQPLTLISGGNGSGKSAILEAICYAIFAKYPRANNQDAIRSGETTARIRMYFALPSEKGDKAYCIERLLSKTAGGTNATLKQVQADGSEVVLETGQSRVTDYIGERLLRGVEYDAFVSTVFLRQEKAGKFMELSHAKQHEQLLRLCRLEIYERIYDRAQKHRKDVEKRLADQRGQFEKVKYATGEHLSDRCKHAKGLQVKRDKMRAEEKTAKRLLEKIKRAASLAGQVEERKEKLTEWSEILGRAEAIRQADQWRIAWERVEGMLNQGRDLYESLSHRAGEIECAEPHLDKAKKEVDRLADEYGGLEAEHQQSAQALNQIRDALPTLVHEKERANRELEAAKEAKRLDGEIARIREEQTERETQLVGFDEVRRRSEYNGLLKQAQNVLQYVLERLNNAEVEQQTAETKDVVAEQAREELSGLQELVEENKVALEDLEKKAEGLGEKRNGLQRLQNRSRDIISNRTQAIEAGACPTCGTEMKGDIGEHVCREVEEHEAQIAAWGEQLQELEYGIASIQSRITQLGTEVDAQKKQMRALDGQAKLAEAAAREARKRATTSRQQASEQWQQHLALWQQISPPNWLKTPTDEVQEEVRKELAELAGINAEYQRLTEVQARFESEAQTLERDEAGRTKLAVESPVTEERLASLKAMFRESEEKWRAEQENRAELAPKVEALKRQLAEAEEELEAARRQLDELDKGLDKLRVSQATEQQYLVSITEALQREQQQLESQFTDLADDLLLAIESSEIYEGLKTLAASYNEEAKLLSELEQAEAESIKVQTEIKVKQEELDSLLEEIDSVSEAEASRRVEDLEADVNAVEQELNEVNREIVYIERDHEQRQSLELRLAEAKSEHWAYRTIEAAIYPGTKTRPAGKLFADITRKLMESISQEAGRILESLGWHIGISYGEREGFRITDQALSAVRKYTEFSGGERFAIAIAVAIAIGRVTHGAGNIRCLFIDEGFGALDQGHRKRIINDAIGKLIEIGSRDQVVVITHLKDMQACFPSRIELKREEDHSALVSPTEEMLE